MGFKYFLPGRQSPCLNSARIDDPILRATIGEDVGLGCGTHDHGPGGANGMMICHPDESLSFEPAVQRWEPVKRNGEVAYYVGWDAKPTPEDLERPLQLPGHVVRMRDGSEWKVPAIHAPNGDPLVPQAMKFINGEFIFSVDPSYDNICREAADIFRRVWSPESKVENFPDATESFQFFAKVMGVNYRVGLVECAMLELFSTDPQWFMREFTAAVFGVKDILDQQEQQKKMAERPPATSNSSAGAVDSPPATAPALLT